MEIYKRCAIVDVGLIKGGTYHEAQGRGSASFENVPME